MNKKTSENHQNHLNEISKAYYEQNMRFYQLLHCGKPFKIWVDGSLKYTTQAWKLYLDTNDNMNLSKKLFDTLSATSSFSNESLLLLIKIIIYSAKLLEAYEKPIESFKAYDKALQLLVKYKDKLDYKADVLFQQQLDGVFDVFKPMELRTELKNKDGRGPFIKSIQKSIGILSNTYSRKCGESFVTVGNVYDDLLTMLVVSGRETITKKIEKRSVDFFDIANRLAQKYGDLKKRNCLSTEHQVYYIELNQYLMNITELMQENSILIVNKIKKDEAYFYEARADRMTDKNINAYLECWDSLKKSWIEPSFLLMKTLNMTEVNTNIFISITYEQALEHWLTVTTRAYVLFKDLKEQWLQTHQTSIITNDIVSQPMRSPIARLEREMEYASNKSRLIVRLASLCDNCTLDPLFSSNVDIIEMVTVFTDTTNLEKDKLLAEKEKKLKVINDNRDALIEEEDKKKAEHEKKIRQRYLYFKEKKASENNQNNENKERPEKTLARSLPVAVNKTLEDLETIDETSILLARSLKHKTTVSLQWLEDQEGEDVSVPSPVQKGMFVNMNATLIDYYHLVTLQEKHIALSERDEIKRDEKLQIGIKVSHTELKNTLPVIYENIQSLLGLINDIIIRQEEKKENKLYGWGLEKAKNLQKTNLSYAEIIKLGKARFREIGINKQLNNQDVSEYTKEKRFLNLMQLHFSGFLYLQKKIGPQLFKNYEEMLEQFNTFNPDLPDSTERFEGFLGLILRQQYEKYEDVTYLQEALKHTTNSLQKYQIQNTHIPAMCEMAHRLAHIEEEMASLHSNDPELLKQALGHYQDALKYNLEAEGSKMELSDIEEVNQRISAIQKLLEESQIKCSPY